MRNNIDTVRLNAFALTPVTLRNPLQKPIRGVRPNPAVRLSISLKRGREAGGESESEGETLWKTAEESRMHAV